MLSRVGPKETASGPDFYWPPYGEDATTSAIDMIATGTNSRIIRWNRTDFHKVRHQRTPLIRHDDYDPQSFPMTRQEIVEKVTGN